MVWGMALSVASMALGGGSANEYDGSADQNGPVASRDAQLAARGIKAEGHEEGDGLDHGQNVQGRMVMALGAFLLLLLLVAVAMR